MSVNRRFAAIGGRGPEKISSPEEVMSISGRKRYSRVSRKLAAVGVVSIAAVLLSSVLVAADTQYAHANGSACFTTGLATTAPAEASKPTQVSGTYQVSSKRELVWVSWATSNWNTGVTGTGTEVSRADALAASYIVTADIDLADCLFSPIGLDTSKPFSGQFDGDEKTISGLNVASNGADVGLFGVVSGSGVVKDLVVEGTVQGTRTSSARQGGIVGTLERGATVDNVTARVNVTSSSPSAWVGGLVGWASGGTIQNSTSSGDVSTSSTSTTSKIGGLVGYLLSDATISNSSATGDVTGVNTVGGLVGESNNSTDITNSSASGTVRGASFVGGLVGKSFDSGTTRRVYSTGTVEASGAYVGGLIGYAEIGYSQIESTVVLESWASGPVSGGTQVGGLIGYAKTNPSYSTTVTIRQSYSSGDVDGNDDVGGLVGQALDARVVIENSYATGDATGGVDVGGLVGASAGTISNSYAVGKASGTSDVGGLVGESARAATASFWDTDTSEVLVSATGVGKTTPEMTTIATYSGASWAITAATAFEDPAIAGPPTEIWAIGEGVNCGYPFLWWQTDSAHSCSAGGSDLPSATASAKTGSPGIFLTVKVRVSQPVNDGSIEFGSFAVAPQAPYILSLESSTPNSPKQILARGEANRGGHAEQELALPSLPAGSHKIVLISRGARGELLTLVNVIGVDGVGRIISLTPEAMQPRIR